VASVSPYWSTKGGGVSLERTDQGRDGEANERGAVDFWDKADLATDGCWTWLAAKNPSGYGIVKWRGKKWLAHRLAFFLINESIPDGMYICHHCDNPSCIPCRPSLYSATQPG
jgi:hypothetical protein